MKARSLIVSTIAALLAGCASDPAFEVRTGPAPAASPARTPTYCNCAGLACLVYGCGVSEEEQQQQKLVELGLAPSSMPAFSGWSKLPPITTPYFPSYEYQYDILAFRDFAYLDAEQASAALSLRKLWTRDAVVSASAALERSDARERPYSHYGWDLGAGMDTFWPRWTFMVGARASVGERRYAEADPLFGEKRSDEKTRLELSVGNKKWRWRDSYVSLVASLERNRSTLGFYSYRKANVSVVVE